MQIYLYFSSSMVTEVKHLAINSFSSCLASFDATLRIIFLRDIFPLFLNLRMFSRLRTRFSFFAFTRHASNSVEVEMVVRGAKVGTGANACFYFLMGFNRMVDD